MTFLGLFFCVAFSLNAQEEPELATKVAKRYMQEAEEALAENDMPAAEAYYRKAIAKDPANAEARYNLGNLYYNKEITSEAVERHGQAATVAEDKGIKHNSFHNRGNAYMKQKKYKEAVEAYKHSLRNNPKDEETRYNLALAKKMLEEEEKKGGGGGQDQQDQDKNKEDKDQQGNQGEQEQEQDGKPDNQEGGEQENQDKKEGQDQKDNQGEPQNQDKQENKPNEGEEQKQPQPRPGQLSPQQVKNLLEAMGNEEKKVQEKINAEKVKGTPAQTEKDW